MKSILFYGKRFIIVFLFILGTTKVFPAVSFNFNSVDGLDMIQINNMINVLKVNGKPWNTPDFSTFEYSFNVLTSTEYNTQKPSDAFAFDCGFVSTNGTINVSAPITTAQLAIFTDINKAAVYYLCQSYMYYFYQTTSLPLLLKVGFAAYESKLDPTDPVIKTAVNTYGGTFSSFDILNNPSVFVTNNGFAVAHAFGEFMNIFKNWGYPQINSVTAAGFDVNSWWYNTNNLQGLLDDFNRYIFARFLEPDENLRIQLVYESENMRIFSRPKDAAINFPMVGDSLETAYKEYSTNYNVKAYQKITGITLAECADPDIDGVTCDPNSGILGGTAWSSGLHFSSTTRSEVLKDVIHMGRHELAHAFEGFMPMGDGTQWLLEGFAFFSDAGPLNADYSNDASPGFWKQLVISSLEKGTTFFGHRPTYEDTKVYPGYETDYGYKYLGYFLCDFIYRKGGYTSVKDVILGDQEGYQNIGYLSGQSIMDAFYFDFDVRLLNKKVATLITPVQNMEETSSSVNIAWIPLSTSVKINVSVSTDNGANWTNIITNTNSTSCSWDAGNFAGKFLVKFSAPDVFNYETTYGPFIKVDLEKPLINFPNGNEFLIAGDTVRLNWTHTTVTNIKIEFSGDNGSSWSMVNSSVPSSSLSYKWIVPGTISDQCKIRISDAADAVNYDLSDDSFTILAPNLIGGPYLVDKNTVLLMHFDNDLNNRSSLAGNGLGSASYIVKDALFSPILGNCYKTSSAVIVTHNANLSLPGDWTIEAWVKLNSYNTNNNMYLFWKPGDIDTYQSNYSLEVNPWWGNVFYGYYFSGLNNRIGLIGASPLLHEWYHVAFTRDAKNKLLQVIVHDKNRNLISTAEMSYSPSESYLNSKDLLIGSNLDGYIDEVRISNIVRTFVIAGVDEIGQEKVFSIYPNPSAGIFKIKMDVTVNSAKISVINATGQTILEKETGNDEIIDLSGFSKGLYLIRITSKNIIQTEKLILR